ncbi:MAG TPA: GDSL-type esterase/lipase family protein [Abditibacteriaceae bacterium]|jgi:lysophospholipase L1-like esterase
MRLKAAIAALLVAGTLTQAKAELILKANDRVVFYGDSITEQRLYTRYVQQYIQCRYPELKIKFYNAGWGGDTAPGGLKRLERDVLWLKPNLVTLFFGMNDGRYRPVEDSITSTFKQGEEGIIKELTGKGVRVVVYTPGAVDYDKKAALKDAKYNENLEALGKAALDLAKQYNLPSADVIHPMIAFQNAQKAKNPNFTMIPDAVHPNAAGHLMMAQEMLKGLGAEPMPLLGNFDLAANTGDGLRVVSNNAAQIVLETTRPVNAPFWVESGSLQVLRDSGFADFVGQKLTVKGAPAGFYKVAVNGADAGKFSAEELAAGVKISGQNFAPAKQIHDLIQRKEDNYFTAWRQVRLPLADIKDAEQIVNGLMAADEGYQTVIHNLAAPLAKLTITLSAAPEGPNLAQGKPYTASDPNKFNWGIGGLTDGSWEATSQHAFATGDAAQFPKNVTIDLQQVTRVGTVTFGVPGFGSTKTVQVAVSADGQNFTDVGQKEFALRKEERATIAFPVKEARYVRLTFADHYAEEVGYTPTFGFLNEVEVYATAK